MDSPPPAPGPPAGTRAGWHYRDARGRACGPYDDDALERLYRFGHVRAATPVWTTGDEDAATPLRQRPDRFRLHGDGRLEVLPRAAPMPPAAAAQAVADATPAQPVTVRAPGAAPSPVETAPRGESPEASSLEERPPGARAPADVADVPAVESSPEPARAAPGPSKRPARRGLAIAVLLAAAAALALLVRLAS